MILGSVMVPAKPMGLGAFSVGCSFVCGAFGRVGEIHCAGGCTPERVQQFSEKSDVGHTDKQIIDRGESVNGNDGDSVATGNTRFALVDRYTKTMS